MRASDIAYEKLRDDIIRWHLEPGTPLGEVDISERFGLSRTPVRAALSRLKSEGLVLSKGSRTVVVAPLAHEDIIKLFELREALETQAARLAARNRDEAIFLELRASILTGLNGTSEDTPMDTYHLADRLDQAINGAILNRYLLGALQDIRGHLARLRRQAHINLHRLDQATFEHLLIVEAIIEQDETLAAQATAVHLRKSLDSILTTMPKQPAQKLSAT